MNKEVVANLVYYYFDFLWEENNDEEFYESCTEVICELFECNENEKIVEEILNIIKKDYLGVEL